MNETFRLLKIPKPYEEWGREWKGGQTNEGEQDGVHAGCYRHGNFCMTGVVEGTDELRGYDLTCAIDPATIGTTTDRF